MRDDTRELMIELLEMNAGPMLWMAHLLSVYGATALYCAGHLPFASGTALLAGSGAVTLLALAVSAWLLVRALREQAQPAASDARRFVNRVTIALVVFGIVAILWTGVPVVLAPACDPQHGA